jgi:zinc protease
MTIKFFTHLKFIGILIVPSLFYGNSYAEVPVSNFLNHDTLPISSLTTLQSLKGINHKKLYQAPFIHDLKNRHHVRTLFVETHDLPIIDIQLTFNAGSARDKEIGKDLLGLSNMVAELMPEGTETLSAQDIATAFENIGAQYSIQAYRDMFIVRLRVLSTSNKLNPAVDMILEILNNAAFKNHNLNLQLNNMNIGKKQINEDPNKLLNSQFDRSIYQNHPYADPITGTVGSLKKINSIELKKFRDQFIVSQNMNIAITGDLTAKEATQLANKISSKLKQGNKAPPLAQPQKVNHFNIQHIPFNSTQAYISMGHLGTSKDNPDRIALEVANRILGNSGFNSILMKELRVKRGFTYAVNSNVTFRQAAGTFNLSYSTRQDQLLDSIQVAHKILVDFTQQPIDPQILEETKMGLLRAFPINYNSNAMINSQLGSIGFYQESADYLNQYQKKLIKLSAKDVQNAVKKHLHPDQLKLVIVSKELDQAQLMQILQQNLLPETKLKELTIHNIPIINAHHQTSEEIHSPSAVPFEVPSSTEDIDQH